MMKAIFKRISLVVLLGVLFIPTAAEALEVRGGEGVSVSSDEVVTENLYVGAGDFSMLGAVEGSLVAAGGQLLVAGEVLDDLTILGGQINVSGDIGGSMQTAGGSVTVSGSVDDDILALAGSVILLPDSTVNGGVVAFGGDITLNGEVNGDVYIDGGSVVINGPVGGDVDIQGGKIEIGSGAVISGDVIHRSGTEANISSEAQIDGEVSSGDLREVYRDGEFAFAGINTKTTGLIFRFLSLLAGALLLGLVLRRFSSRVVERSLSQTWWKHTLLGFALLVLIPVAFIILVATFIGIPVGIMVILSYVSFLIAGWFTAAIVFGSLILKWTAKEDTGSISWQSITIGVIAYFLLTFIPIVGWVAQFLLFITAIGAIGIVSWRGVKDKLQ
ncbi:MAG: polymer-forming cytoskeletal protein [Candidatus Campbellbacteria bacterium]|nr:polymer-forming cytoskeletal protein [Candidatus Campbellbacteria bacterium]